MDTTAMPNPDNKNLLRCTVNGKEHEQSIPDNLLLVDYLREYLGLTGTKHGCELGECGPCAQRTWIRTVPRAPGCF